MRAARFLLVMALLALPCAALAADSLMMATSADIRNSGLLEYLKPLALKETGITLTWLSTDAGTALEHGKNCDVDVLLVHAPDAELKMLEEAFVVDRRRVMYSDVVDAVRKDNRPPAVPIEGGGSLRRQYSVMTVNPAKCPKVRAALAKKFADWWVCPSTQNHIAAFKPEGRQLFFPNAAPPSR